MINAIQDYLREFAYLFYPPQCVYCGKLLHEAERAVCFYCEHNLAYLNYAKDSENVVEKLFWGRVPIERAMALVQFIHDGITQSLLHELKYKGNYNVGKELGLFLGRYINRKSYFEGLDYIVPVPLHWTRYLSRGYNHSEMIVLGMQEVLDVEIDKKNLVRVIANSSQTDKGREERIDNVKGIFSLKDPKVFEGKHILLVDDVVTTGSTLISCMEALQESPGIRVSVATVAKA